jgi:hypothetical protein
VRGLSNYLMLESLNKDARFQKHANTYVKKEIDSMKTTIFDQNDDDNR